MREIDVGGVASEASGQAAAIAASMRFSMSATVSSTSIPFKGVKLLWASMGLSIAFLTSETLEKFERFEEEVEVNEGRGGNSRVEREGGRGDV